MNNRLFSLAIFCLLATDLLLATVAAHAQGTPAAAIADYDAKLAQYQAARGPYEAEASVYWEAVSEKRRARNAKRRDHVPITLDDYVLTQPPVYTGPPRPVDPRAPAAPPPERPEIPVVADFLKNAAEHFGFVPDRPASDLDFKRAYAKAALASGLTRDQIVGVYAFETGGNGTYDFASGTGALQARRSRDFARRWLQPVAQHQYGLAPCRRRQPLSPGAAPASKRAIRSCEDSDGAKD